MEPFIHITGSTFQYTDLTAYLEHTARASPSDFFPVLQSRETDALIRDFDYLGDRLYNHTSDVLATGGLFHLKAFAHQMLAFDAELRRRSESGEWCERDLSVTRTSLRTIDGITILPPDTPRRRRTHRRPVRRMGERSAVTFGTPATVDPDDALSEPLHPVRPAPWRPGTTRRARPLDWILGETTSEANVAPGVNATPDGRTQIGGVYIRIGQAGNLPRMQRQYIQEGEEDARRDFGRADRGRAHRDRQRSGRYRGNSDYRHGYDQRWQALERTAAH